jgi:hypothetical protein
MREMIKIITSAWSVAFIILFFLVAAAPTPTDTSITPIRDWEILVLFALAITGAGWLLARRMERKRRGTSSMGLTDLRKQTSIHL